MDPNLIKKQIKHFFVGVKGLILRDNNKILLLKPRRSKHPSGFIGNWDIPGGRILKHSEGEHRLRAKIEEETDITDIYSIKPFGAGIIDKAVFMEEDSPVGLVLMVYICKVGRSQKQISISSEHSEYGWFTLQETASRLYQFPDDFRERLSNFNSQNL